MCWHTWHMSGQAFISKRLVDISWMYHLTCATVDLTTLLIRCHLLTTRSGSWWYYLTRWHTLTARSISGHTVTRRPFALSGLTAGGLVGRQQNRSYVRQYRVALMEEAITASRWHGVWTSDSFGQVWLVWSVSWSNIDGMLDRLVKLTCNVRTAGQTYMEC